MQTLEKTIQHTIFYVLLLGITVGVVMTLTGFGTTRIITGIVGIAIFILFMVKFRQLVTALEPFKEAVSDETPTGEPDGAESGPESL